MPIAHSSLAGRRRPPRDRLGTPHGRGGPGRHQGGARRHARRRTRQEESMAEPVRFGGVEVTKRNPWGVWGLTLITFGIYGIVWWYKINREVRDYSAAVGRP